MSSYIQRNPTSITVRVATDENLQIRNQSGTVQIRAVNDAADAFVNLLIDAANIRFNSQSGGTETHYGLSTFNNGITVAGGTLSLPFTAGSIPYIGASSAVSQDNAKLFWDATNKMLGVGTNTPFVDNNSEVGAVVRDDVSAATRFSVVNRSTNVAARTEMNLSLGSGTGFNFTMQAVEIAGTKYALIAVDDTTPAWAGIFMAAPAFAWENQLQTQNWMNLDATGLNLVLPLIMAGGVYIEGFEQTAPAAGVANSYRIFAQDSGGKTQLMVQFATGAAQQLAIQP